MGRCFEMLHTNLLTYPELAERKTVPLDISNLLRQSQEYQAVTGVEPTAAKLADIARPELMAGVRESLTGQRVEDIRRQEVKGQAFKEYGFEKGMEFKERALGEVIELKEEEIKMAEEKAMMGFWGDVLGIGLGIMMFTPLGIPAVVGGAIAGGAVGGIIAEKTGAM